MDASSGIVLGSETSDVSATSEASEASTISSGVSPDGTCVDHSDCGALMCWDGRCHGCATFEDCPGDLLCYVQICMPASEAPMCIASDAPTCGDGVIGALEECDATPGCDACRREDVFEAWFDDEGIRSFMVLPDGGALTAGSEAGPGITRHDASGAAIWSAAVEYQVSFASDADSEIYGAGSSMPGGTWFPYVEARDSTGAVEWTVQESTPGHYYAVEADDTRVLVGGITEQANSPSGRASLAQYTTFGELQWSRKIVEWGNVGALVLDGTEANVLGVHLYPPIPWTLMRIDEEGETSWSVPVAADLSPIPGLRGVTGDGGGGTWIFGERASGPWAIRYDAAGVEVDEIDCFAGTAGWFTDLAVGPLGVVAVGVLVTSGPIPLARARPWVAIVDDGVVTRGIAFGEDERTERLFDLAWRADGQLVIGLEQSDPDEVHVLVVAP